MLLYLLSKKTSLINMVLFGLTALLFFVIPNLPYIFETSFLEMVFQNREQVKLYRSNLSIGGVPFYLVPASYLLLVFKGFSIKGYNRDVFIMLLAFSFGVILLFTEAVQGWYVWLVPFLTYFYSKSDRDLIRTFFC